MEQQPERVKWEVFAWCPIHNSPILYFKEASIFICQTGGEEIKKADQAIEVVGKFFPF